MGNYVTSNDGPIRQRGAEEALKKFAEAGHDVARLEAPAGWNRLDGEEEE